MIGPGAIGAVRLRLCGSAIIKSEPQRSIARAGGARSVDGVVHGGGALATRACELAGSRGDLVTRQRRSY